MCNEEARYASMGPAVDTAGNHILDCRRRCRPPASMGPAVDTAGNLLTVLTGEKTVGASMGPAVDTAGNHQQSELSYAICHLLQWGQRLIPLETDTDALSGIVGAPMLQWGQRLIPLETVLT